MRNKYTMGYITLLDICTWIWNPPIRGARVRLADPILKASIIYTFINLQITNAKLIYMYLLKGYRWWRCLYIFLRQIIRRHYPTDVYKLYNWKDLFLISELERTIVVNACVSRRWTIKSEVSATEKTLLLIYRYIETLWNFENLAMKYQKYRFPPKFSIRFWPS